MADSFNARSTLDVDGDHYEIFRLDALANRFDLSRLPFSLKILIENLLRHEDGVSITRSDIEALAAWDPTAEPSVEIAFTPSRVLLQDFTGVPAVVDLAAMRDAMRNLGGDPERINPLSPVELVIDHSVQVDRFASPDALARNTEIEFSRNQERYAFLRWGQQAFRNFKVVPPGTGIVHQINLEHLARVVFDRDHEGVLRAYPDTVVGTDSHTTMVNGLGVLGWGVGGIEAEAAMLGQPISMLIPQVVGFELTGTLPEGATATDLVLTVVQMLRKRGVVGKFVEFYGEGLDRLPLADRATIANMAPEYGATCGIFPIDAESLAYLHLSGRSKKKIALVEAYARTQGMFRNPEDPAAIYTDTLHLDMSEVEPCISGPKRPQDRIPLHQAGSVVKEHLQKMQGERDATDQPDAKGKDKGNGGITVQKGDASYTLKDGAIVIAAITSCTNTSNPAVLIGAGLLARNALERGLRVRPWVKTSLAPGSMVVKDYLAKAGLLDDLEGLGFHVVGFGCTTCIGNSGPLPDEVGKAIEEGNLIVSAALSGNRNFEGRIHGDVKMNFLASPPLVVAYALAGRCDMDFSSEPLGEDTQGNPVFLRDIWPSGSEIQTTIAESISPDIFRAGYEGVFDGDERWQSMETPEADRFRWDSTSTYINNPPYFDGMSMNPRGIPSIRKARMLALLGDSITTDHISPAGAITQESPAGRFLQERQVPPREFNSYGSRRGNHEVMMRGTFANIRLRNRIAPGTEGGWTKHQPSGEQMSIYDAAMRYKQEGTPLIVIGGKEYGTGSSRDWAAKGTLLLGVAAVLVQSFERIHRSNLVGMGVLPLTFVDGESAESLGLDADRTYDIEGLEKGAESVKIIATAPDGTHTEFQAKVRIDTPMEWDYYEHGGILHYVVRQLAA
ncbi:aconitate hydratase AcnA [Thioalkalivibrio sp. HK1]|uniref:aconitate hydratase AcnA n=1 Tax=Thioalkalivibrio sp. HK1 TaxID=1469245 RepID=UPI00046FD426|nr:aconitate hydratase AcnA [Thioalkalivibrio sp. HK1]